MKTTRILALIIAVLALPALAQPPADVPDCDRDCLNSYVDRYIDAMVAKDVSDDLFAREVKFTENGIRLPLGNEGSWFLSTGRGGYSFYVPDVETRQVAFLGTVVEGDDTLVGFSLRLKIRDGLIIEVEQLVTRPEVSLGGGGGSSSPFPETGAAVEAMGAPHPAFAEDIPEDERPSREELIETANYYFTGLQQNDGQGYYPFTDDCIRFENGTDVLANITDPETGESGRMTCKRQFEVALKDIVSRVRDRRFVAVDRQKGIVFAFAFFDHEQINWTWQLAELFKIENGLISRIEAIFHQAPYGIPSGWSTYEQAMSDDIQDVR